MNILYYAQKLYNVFMKLKKTFKFKIKSVDYKIWAGLTDHLMCKPELFLDNRFQVITLIMVGHDIQWYLEPIVHSSSYCRSFQKVENKSFKKRGSNLNIWPEAWPKLENMLLFRLRSNAWGRMRPTSDVLLKRPMIGEKWLLLSPK